MNRLRIATLIVAAGCASTAAAQPALEVRFYPERELRLQETNAQRGLWSALLQNASIVNRGAAPLTLETVTVELVAGDELAQSHPISGTTLAALAARSGQLGASGMLELLAFHFRPERLLAGGKAVGSTTLAPGEALLLGHRAFTVQGAAVDRLRIEVDARDGSGRAIEGRGELPIRRGTSSNRYLFPLAGDWFVAAGASFHTHHRWVVAEEFALDIARLGAGGRTHRGDPERNESYLAWEAVVRAPADGTVVSVVDRFDDIAPLVRGAGESSEAYFGRIQQGQMALLMQGAEAIGGNAVTIAHADGEFSHSLHLRRGSVLVKVGDAVKRGQPIAKLGNSGNSTEPHLHFQVTDGAAPLDSAGIPIELDGLEILFADLPRAVQSGDMVRAD